MADSTPYSTAKKMLGRLPDYIADDIERERVAAYALYEDMYWLVPETFRITQRGSNSDPIYLPSGRQIVETLNRFLCPSPSIIVDPEYGTPVERELAKQVMASFVDREKFFAKFNTGKRYGLIRGDQVWHIWADPEREDGSKVSIYQIDPGSVFPVYQENNIDVIIGYHIIDQFVNNFGKTFVSRQTYMKETETGGPSRIYYSKAIYDVDDWGGPGMEDPDPTPVEVVTPPTLLPPPIDALPIYVIPNFDEPGAIFGSSEMRGMERIFAGLNQAISDEDLSLALEGLGVYATDAGTPLDDNDDPVAWNLGPGRVVELSMGRKFWRVQGNGSFAPYQQHLKFLLDQIDQTFGHSEVAKGKVDVATAESGVALMLELGPLLARAQEREVIIDSVMHQMLYGLGKWWTAFEGNEFSSLWEVTKWRMRYGSRVPSNRQQDLKNLLDIARVSPQIVPMSWVREQLRSLDFNLPEQDTMEAEILLEMEARALASSASQETPEESGEEDDPLGGGNVDS